MTERTFEDEGIDFRGGLSRFGNNKDLYLKFLKRFPEDPNYQKAKEAIEGGDKQSLLFHVHALKGVAGNLSITSVFEISSDMVSVLRCGEIEEELLRMQFCQLQEAYETAIDAIQKL